MKILILDKDAEYAKRLEHHVNRYSSEMQIYHFDSRDKMTAYMEQHDYDVVLCGEMDGIAIEADLELPVTGIPFAWLSKNNERVNDQDTIFKYQSVVHIYEQLCDLYENVYRNKVNRQTTVENSQSDDKGSSVITFLPVHGGAGSSVMSIACAQHFSETHNVLYINLEEFACESFFVSDNTRTVSDIIAEFKGKYTKDSITKMLDLCTSEASGVNNGKLSFIKGCKNPVDITFINTKMLTEIIASLREMNRYDYIIVDAGMVINDCTAALIKSSDKLVFTTDASDNSNSKLKKVQRYVQITERESENKAEQYLIYNKFYSDASLAEYTKGMVVVGTFGRYRLQDNQQISRQTVVKNISRTPQLFERLM